MFPSLDRYRSRRYRVFDFVAALALCVAYAFSEKPSEGVQRCDPITVAIVSVAASVALSGAQYLLQVRAINSRNRKNPQDRGRNDDLRIQTSEYGASIPILKGDGRFAGNIIDGKDIQVLPSTTRGARVKKVQAPSTIQYTYACSFIVLLCETSASGIQGVRRIWQDADVIYDRDADGTGGGDFTSTTGRKVTGVIDPDEPYPVDLDDASDFYHATATDDGDSFAGDWQYGSWRVWKGKSTQVQQPELVAIHGADLTPAYRYRCCAAVYVLVKDGRLPSFTFEIEEGTQGAGDCVTSLYELNGVTSSELDVTALSADEQDGFLIAARQQLKQPIEDLGVYHKFDMVDVDGKLKAVKRNGASVATIPADDLRAHEEGEEPPDFDALVEDAEELTLPQMVEVGYIDASPGADYHHNVQPAPKGIGNSQELSNVNLPIVMTPDNARQLAEYLLARAHIESRTARFQTGWKYLFLHPNDVVTIEADGVSLVVRITQMNMAIPAGVIKFQGVVQESTILTQGAAGSAGSGLEAPVIPFPGNQKLILIETPPIHDGDDRLIAYIGSALRGDGTFRGAFVYRANPASDYDDLITTFPEQSTIGVTASTLASALPHNFDSTGILVVDLFQGTFSSCTQAELVADPYKNLLAVRNSLGEVEYIQFTTAIADTASWPYKARYTIFGLLRGRFLTEAAAASHGTNCDVLLMDGTVQTVEFEPTDVGRTLLLKSVSAGQQVTDAPAVSVTLTGRSLSPSAPVNLTGTRNSDNDLLIEWTRRGRLASLLRGFNSPPLGEEREEWAVDVFTAGGAAFKRTIRVVPPYQTEAVLTSDKRLGKGSEHDQITGNTADGFGTSAGTPRSFQYASLQRITRPGNFVSATLTSSAPIDVAGLATLGLLNAFVEWRKKTVTPFIEVRVEYDTTRINVNGVEVYSSSDHPNGTRWTLELTSDAVHVYASYNGHVSSVPVYSMATAPTYPLRVFGSVVRATSSAADVVLTTTPEAKAVYTAAQQTEDGYTPGDLVYVRIRAVSAVVGFGQSATATL